MASDLGDWCRWMPEECIPEWAKHSMREAYRAGLDDAADYLQDHGEACNTCCLCACGDKELDKLRAYAKSAHSGNKESDDAPM